MSLWRRVPIATGFRPGEAGWPSFDRSAGEQRQINLVSGQSAWNQVGNASQPAVAAAEQRQLQIWLTPHGFLHAAVESRDLIHHGTDRQLAFMEQMSLILADVIRIHDCPMPFALLQMLRVSSASPWRRSPQDS